MPLRTILLLNVTLVTNGRINYFNLFLVEGLALVVGVALWMFGLDLWRGPGWARKAAGAALLLLALGYSLGWLGFNLYEYLQLREFS